MTRRFGGEHDSSSRKSGNISRKRGRIWVLQGALVLTLATVLWRVYNVQNVYGEKLKLNVAKTIDVSNRMMAPRGSILDAQGDKLAYDLAAYHLDIKTAGLQSYIVQISTQLAPILGVSVASAKSFLTTSNKWEQWPHTITQPQKDQIQHVFSKHLFAPQDNKTLWQGDVTFTPTEQRFYPFNDFVANTIGFMSTTGQAVGGIEQEYNAALAGSDGQITYQRDAYGFPIPNTQHVIRQAKPGNDIALTVDATIQGYVENVMNQMVAKYNPQHAAIIVTNPQTGAVLAMSSRPSFNPNQYWTATPAALNENWAVSSSFEPGSTFKPIVLATALATHSIKLNDTFKSGQTVVAGQTINDWNYGRGWGVLTFQQALEKSSNVGFTKIATATGWLNFDQYLNLFGITQKTGIDLPDESAPDLFPKSNQHAIQLATSGFGQGIAVTPLQQVAAIGAIANGGRLMKPFVASKIVGPDGHVVKTMSPTVVRQHFLPASVVDEVNQTMVLDVSGKDGIDTAARIPGYDVAGKTGTAQIVDPKTGQYYADRFETSFIGYAPANNPKVEVYVTLYWPKTKAGNQWGSTVATPPAAEILRDCLQYYHVPPNGAAQSVVKAFAQNGFQTTYVQTQNIVGLTKAQATAKLTSLGLRVVFAGQSGKIQRQWPVSGIEMAKGSTMYALLETTPTSEVVVPNLVGMSMRSATNLLAAMELNINPIGYGFVTSQSTSPGTKVSSGTTLDVTFAPRS